MGALDAQYSPFSWLSFQGNLSYDRTNLKEVNITPSPWKRAYPRPPLDGAMFRLEDLREELNGNLTASIQHSFGDLTTRTRFRWLAEQTSSDNFVAGGSTFSVVGVPQMGLLTTGTVHALARGNGSFAGAVRHHRPDLEEQVHPRPPGPPRRKLAVRTGRALAELLPRLRGVADGGGGVVAARLPHRVQAPLFAGHRRRARPGFSYQYQTYAVDRGAHHPQAARKQRAQARTGDGAGIRGST